MKRIIEEIEESVRIHGHDGQQGLGMWLDYLVDMFDVKYIVNGTYDKHLEDKAKEVYLRTLPFEYQFLPVHMA